jgi:hypothetical protein
VAAKKSSVVVPERGSFQALISRMPYAKTWDSAPVIDQASQVDKRGLICLSMPIHVDAPGNGAKLLTELEIAGFHLVSLISWHRDRHVVTTRSRRITNAWEPIAVLCRGKDWHIDRDGPARPRRGAAGREEQFDEDEFLTCIGDHWPVRCDRRERRLLPSLVILNLIQLAGLGKGDKILDPWGNPTIQEQCDALGLNYHDGGLPNQLRTDWARGHRKADDETEEEG